MLQHLLGLWHEYWETKPLSCYKKERLIGCSFVTPNLNLKAKLPKCKCFLPACLTSPSACGPPLIKCIQNSRNGGTRSELRVALPRSSFARANRSLTDERRGSEWKVNPPLHLGCIFPCWHFRLEDTREGRRDLAPRGWRISLSYTDPNYQSALFWELWMLHEWINNKVSHSGLSLAILGSWQCKGGIPRMSDALNARLDRCSLGTLKLKGRKSERASPKAQHINCHFWAGKRNEGTVHRWRPQRGGRGFPEEDAVG